MASELKCKTIQIAVAGTPTQAETALTFARRLKLHNPGANTGLIFFGGSDLSATKRASLVPGEWLTLEEINLANFYVDVAVNNESVEIVIL